MAEQIFFAVNLQTGQPIKTIGQLKDETKRLQKELDGTKVGTKRFNQLKDSITRNRAEIRKFNRDINQSQPIANRFAQGFVKAFTQIAGAFSLVLAAQVVIKTIGDTINEFRELEKALTRVNVLTGATAEEFTKLEQQTRELGATTAFTATQAAEAQVFLAQAGFDANQITQALPATLNLAAAGQLDLARSADIASNVLKAFNLDASETTRVADVLAETAASSNTNVEQLGEAFKLAAPFASTAGVSLEETAAIIGTLGDAGVQASLAGTGLRGVIAALLKPSKEAQGVINRLGIEIQDSEGNLRPLNEIFQDFNKANANATDLVTVFGRRQASVASVLVRSSETLRDGTTQLQNFTKEVVNAGGRSAEIAEAQLDNLDGSLIKLNSAFTELQLVIGDALGEGALRPIVDIITDLINQFTGMTERSAEVQLVVDLLSATFESLKFSIKLLLAPIVVALKIVGGAISVFSELYLLVKNFVIDEAINPLVNIFKTDVLPIFREIRSATRGLLESFLGLGDALLSKVGVNIDVVKGGLKSFDDALGTTREEIAKDIEVFDKLEAAAKANNREIQELVRLNEEGDFELTEEAIKMILAFQKANREIPKTKVALEDFSDVVIPTAEDLDKFNKQLEKAAEEGEEFALKVAENERDVVKANQDASYQLAQIEADRLDRQGKFDQAAQLRLEAEIERTKQLVNNQETTAEEQALLEAQLEEKKLEIQQNALEKKEKLSNRSAQIEADDLERRRLQAQEENEISLLRIQAASKFTDALIDLVGAQTAIGKTLIAFQRTLAVAEVFINLQREISAINANVTNNLLPPGIAQAAKLLQIASAVARVTGIIASIKSVQPPQQTTLQQGGILEGASHADGGIPVKLGSGGFVEAEGGEAIINKRSTSLFKPLLSKINQAGGGKRFQTGGIFPDAGISPEVQANANLLRQIRSIEINPVVSVEEIETVRTNVQVIEQSSKI